MNFNNHSDLVDKHAFLSASSYHWLNYDVAKLTTVYNNHKAKEEGTILHAFAEIAIRKRLKQANQKKALNMFINDSIGHKMTPEQVLYYSLNSFGTADAISFKDGLLRIFDLKTGFSKASFKQLHIYSALFCLEYGVDPLKIEIELRIYQGNGFEIDVPEPFYIQEIMNRIIEFDTVLEDIKKLG